MIGDATIASEQVIANVTPVPGTLGSNPNAAANASNAPLPVP